MLSSVRAWVDTKKLILPMLLVAVLSISAVATATEVVRAQEQTKEKTIEKTVYVPADQSQNVSGGVLGGSSSWLWGLLGLLGLFGLARPETGPQRRRWGHLKPTERDE